MIEAEIELLQMQAKQHQELPKKSSETRKKQERILSRFYMEHSLGGILILDFWPPEKEISIALSHAVCDTLLWKS